MRVLCGSGYGTPASDNVADVTKSHNTEMPLRTRIPTSHFLVKICSHTHKHAMEKEAAETRLSALKLHGPARRSRRSTSPSVLEIVDVDHPVRADLPYSLPAGHRVEFHRREETRIKAMAQNRSNDQRRRTAILEARTTVYALLKTCTGKSAPVLQRPGSKLLKDSCDLHAHYAVCLVATLTALVLGRSFCTSENLSYEVRKTRITIARPSASKGRLFDISSKFPS